MLRALASLSFVLGTYRRLIGRVAGLCLVLMGVHAAADRLDDVVYPVLDSVDLFLDETVASVLAWMADAGGITPAQAIARSEAFASLADLAEKDKLAIVIALLVELGLDVLLLRLAWGRHEDLLVREDVLATLRASAREVADALRPVDLEKLAVLPTLCLFAVGGALLTARAFENACRDVLSDLAPGFVWGSPVAAGAGILGAALLLWRFAPDLLDGALRISKTRGDQARALTIAKLERPHRLPRLYRAGVLLRIRARGAWLVAAGLPLAVAGLNAQDVAGLIARATPMP